MHRACAQQRHRVAAMEATVGGGALGGGDSPSRPLSGLEGNEASESARTALTGPGSSQRDGGPRPRRAVSEGAVSGKP